MPETTYKYRNKDLTYDQFMEGPGAKMSTDEALATLDKLSGATKSRRALQVAMAKSGAKMVSAGADGVKFTSESGDLTFGTFGEVEQYLIGKGLIKDEKAEAAKKAAEKKAKDAARKVAQKEKDAAKKAADKVKKYAKKEALKKKEAEKRAADRAKAKEKKEALKKKEAEKKAAEQVKAKEKKAATAKKTAAKKPVAKATVSKTTVKKASKVAKKAAPAAKKAVAAKKTTKAAAKKPTVAAKKATTGKTTGRKAAPVARKTVKTAAKNAPKTQAKGAARKSRSVAIPESIGDFVIRVGKKNYTQERLKKLALDVYQYDMGKDPKSVKTVKTTVLADAKKCQFVVNGKEKGEFEL